MTTQEIKITASIILEVPIELSKKDIMDKLNNSTVTLCCTQVEFDDSFTEGFMEIIEIEEEAQIYGNE